jgi:hypothetical protein
MLGNGQSTGTLIAREFFEGSIPPNPHLQIPMTDQLPNPFQNRHLSCPGAKTSTTGTGFQVPLGKVGPEIIWAKWVIPGLVTFVGEHEVRWRLEGYP